MNENELINKDQKNILLKKVFEYNNLSEVEIIDILNINQVLKLCETPSFNLVVQRILKAKNNNEKVLIAGDYDCDGICATTIMKNTLDILQINNGYYIPNRLNEGYGLNISTVNLASNKGYDLIITVDNGVAAKDAIELCNQKNIEIIITDHHLIQEVYTWDFLLHPSNMGDDFSYLCGAGIAYILSLKLIGNNQLNAALACIATIGDMMQLKKQNRVIVKNGLNIINQSNISVIKGLIDAKTQIVDETVIAYQIVPKINALGRLSDKYNPNTLVKYFLSNDQDLILNFSLQINNVNNERKKLSKKACDLVNTFLTDDKFNVIKSDEISEGIVGLVAGSVARNTNKPTIIMTNNKDKLKGSARSDGQLDLMEFFDDFKNSFTSFGGHKMACGIEIKVEDFTIFNNYVQTKMKDYVFEEKSDYLNISLADLNVEDFIQLKKYYPFGQGFVLPELCIDNFEVNNTLIIKDIYPKWNLKSSSNHLEAISFKLKKDCLDLNIEKIVGSLSINNYNGNSKLSLIVSKVYN